MGITFYDCYCKFKCGNKIVKKDIIAKEKFCTLNRVLKLNMPAFCYTCGDEFKSIGSAGLYTYLFYISSNCSIEDISSLLGVTLKEVEELIKAGFKYLDEESSWKFIEAYKE